MLFIGSYDHGIAVATVDPESRLPTLVGAAADTPNPSYLARHGDVLYAVNECDPGEVSAFAISDGAISEGASLRPLGSRATHGVAPCHVSAHAGHVLVANYISGSVAVHPINGDGGLAEASDVVRHSGSGPDADRQDGPHAHQVLADPAGRYLHAVDLGADTIFAYRLEGGRLRAVGEVRVRAGAGPRHLAWHPSGRQAYLTDELASTVTVCGHDPERGSLTPLWTGPTAPPTGERNYPSELLVSPDGRFVYVANRGHNSVAVFAVDGDRLIPRGTAPCGGDFPRHIAFSRDGRFLYVANQRSGHLATLRVDSRDGSLTSAGPAISTGAPSMVLPV